MDNPSTTGARPLQAVQEVLHPHLPQMFARLQNRNFFCNCNRLKNNLWPRNVIEKNGMKFQSLAVENLPRRLMLCVGLVPLLSFIDPVFAAPAPDLAPDVIRMRNLPSGVKIQDVTEGDGKEAVEGDTVEFNYVCRRSNGYFVYSTVDQFSGEAAPVTLPLDDKQMIEGLKDVLVGMRVGGKRRALIPPSLGYINESLKPIPEEFGPRRSLLSHAGEPLVFEVQLLKVL